MPSSRALLALDESGSERHSNVNGTPSVGQPQRFRQVADARFVVGLRLSRAFSHGR